MKVLHLASFDRWTGAAAIAFTEAEALRNAAIEASYGYVGGYSLEEKIDGIEWADPILVPGEHPIPILRNIRTLRRLVHLQRYDVIHAHLSHDHWLARFSIGRRSSPVIVRTFHSERALRKDRLTKWLIGSTDACAVVNPTLTAHPVLAGRTVSLTPPPLEPHYVPDGPSARSLYGLDDQTTLLGCIGKISPGRGFEAAIEAFAIVRKQRPASRLLIIGHGPHRKHLEELAARLDLDSTVIFAGYHEADLADHFRAIDLMFFTASGSDEGHRAIIEANGCGTPVVTYPIPGARYIVGNLADELIVGEPTPESLAQRALRILPDRLGTLSERATENADRFNYARTSSRLLELYASALGR